MNITTAQVKDIKTEFAKLKPEKITLSGNRSLTVKEAVFALAPTLERMKKRGFDTQELVEKLNIKGIEVHPATLAKYLSEFRRQQARKPDSSAPAKRKDTPQTDAVTPTAAKPEAIRTQERTPGSIAITPDTPIDAL